MIKYIVKNCLNKKRKEKVIHKFIPKFPGIYSNFVEFIELTEGKKREHVIKLLGQF